MSTPKPYPPDMSGVGNPKYGTFVQEATDAIKAQDRATLKAVFRRFRVTWMARKQAVFPIKQPRTMDDITAAFCAFITLADDLEDALDALGVVFDGLLAEDEGTSDGN
jgi:hypothetical protein